MWRDTAITEIWDGRFYGRDDMAKTGCGSCEGCSDCCRNTGDSIILDPLDMYSLTIGTHKKFEEMIEKEIEIRMTDGMILPNIMEYDEANPDRPEGCPFLDENGRCGIYAYRPGFCRLFPLGRYYIDEPAENGRKRGFHYILQKDECSKKDAERYDVRISDWIGLEDMESYETFVCTWHFFLKDTAAQMERYPEQARDQIARSVLQIFYVQPYQRSKEFYPQFYARLERTEKQLSKLGFKYTD
jgi:Fe-S-cluster containining protein